MLAAGPHIDEGIEPLEFEAAGTYYDIPHHAARVGAEDNLGGRVRPWGACMARWETARCLDCAQFTRLRVTRRGDGSERALPSGCARG